MSRRIDIYAAPLTEEEKEHLLTRSGGEALIAVNNRIFGELSKVEKKAARATAAEIKALEEEVVGDDEYHPADIKKVESLSIAQMRAALKKAGLAQDVTQEDKDELGENGEEVTDKEVLAIRLLNYLDEIRRSKK